VIGRIARLRAEVLGLNRRNHAYLFAHNPRHGYRVVDDKRATKTVLAAHGVPAPALQAVCETQWGVRALGERLVHASDFVLKPAHGAGGAGIVVIVGRDGERFVKASGEHLTRADLEAHTCDVLAGAFSAGPCDDVLLVEERVVPEAELGALAYRGVPDIRVLVFRGVPVLAMLRLPTERSDGRANLHLGGVGVGIELDGGQTTYAVMDGRPVASHPDLGCDLRGIAVPRWDEVLLLAVRASDAVQLGFVGVDVVIDARHGPLVLELNARPGLTVQLANRRGLRPLLDAVATGTPPETAAERVAVGCSIAAQLAGSSR
jgi:alpha-L-glutamate ligase-like protein